MLFDWSPEKIEYYRKAGDYTGFFAKILSLLLPLFSDDDEVADLGCGLGLFDLLLSPHVRHIDSIDEHADAIAELNRLIVDQNINNISPIIESVENLHDCEWDVIFMSFFGEDADVLSDLLKMARKRTIIVTHNDDKARRDRDRFSKRRLSNATAIAGHFNDIGIPYQRFDYLLDFGQPFTSIEDAEKFAACYMINGGKELMLSSLIEINDGEFNYFLPKDKNISAFVVDTDGVNMVR